MYIGNIGLAEEDQMIWEDGGIVRRNIVHSAGMTRLFLEILINASDNVEASRKEGIDPGHIYVTVKGGVVRVKNEGRPFSCKTHRSGQPIPVVALGSLMSSTKFKERGAVGGCNGVGGACTNAFSLIFNLVVCNGVERKRLKVQWKNNMVLEKVIEEEYDGPSWTEVSYLLDFARFYDDDVVHGMVGRREYTDDMIHLFKKHTVDISFNAQVPVYFNGERMDYTNILDYASLYGKISSYKMWETNDSRCLVADTDTPYIISFVNCVINEQGGVHLDEWKKRIYAPVIKACKKYGVKKSHLDGRLSIILSCRLSNVVYVHQTKDKVASPTPIIDVNVDSNDIVTWACIKALVERLKLISSSLANVSIKNDGRKTRTVNIRNMKNALRAGGPDSHLCTLYLCEGDSAYNYLIKKIDGQYEGALSLRGKFLNVSKCDKESYDENDVIKNIKKALGLKENTDYSGDNYYQLRYGRVCCVFDADVDGQHIAGLWYNFVRKRFPSLLERDPSFISVMKTPLIRVEYGKKREVFYSSVEYNDWCRNNPDVRHKASYYKGLAANNDREVAESYAMKKIVEYKWDDDAEENMAMAFDNGFIEDRKEWVMSWNPDTGTSSRSSEYSEDMISHFIHHELCEFSYENVQRTIPSGVDGLKNSQRKIMAVVMSMKKNEMIKVFQLMGRVSDTMQYKHGETSLYHAIVNLGNYYVGSNNIPLIQAEGQYQSRQGGKAGSERYIRAAPSPILPYIFREEDSIILKRMVDEGVEVEPKYYFPIIPLFAVNGCDGIGSGFGMSLPAYSPKSIIAYISWWLKKGDIDQRPELKPYYFNYKGDIYKDGDSWYSKGACMFVDSRKKIKDILITELPVTHTIDSYLNKLTSIIEKKGVKAEYVDSAKSYDYTYKGVLRTEMVPNITVIGFPTTNPLIDLGLVEKIPTPCIVLLDHNSIPRPFGSDIYGAISFYCTYRLKAYGLRRAALLKMWKESVETMRLKQSYIYDVVRGRISFRREDDTPKPKDTLVSEVEGMGYPRSFLSIPIISLTLDNIQSIQKDIDHIQAKIDRYESSTPSSLWRDDLKDLVQYLK